WRAAMMAMGWENEALAALAAPAYALGFAGVLIWLFRVAGLSDYYQSLKGVDAKTFLRRLVKPIPFGAVLAVALLVIAPNAMYAIDSGIATNDKEAYNEKTGVERELFGSIGYYVEGSDARDRSDFFESLSGTPKSGAMVTGQSAVVDASANGFSSVSDSQGNGLVAASHILLSNGGNGEAIAAMMYRIISSKGGIAAFKDQLTGPDGLSDAAYGTLVERDRDVAKSRAEILADPDRYGKFRPDMDDESVRYVVFKSTLVDECDVYQIASMYDAVCEKADAKITYVAVSGDMLPLSMRSQAIVNMYVAGYYVDSSAKAQFISAFQYGQQTYFNGVKDAFADTVLWRAAIGLMPSDGKGAQSLFNDVGDGSAVPVPGNGLSCFKVVRWDIKYNPAEDAEYDSEGWVVLPAAEALRRYGEDGGTIGHVSSLPVVLEYVSPAGNGVSGTVTHGADKVKGIEVSTVDANGRVMSIAITGEDGKYALPVIGGEAEVRFRAGVHDGKGFALASKPVEAVVDYDIPATSYEGKLVPREFIGGLVFKGKASGAEYAVAPVGETVNVPSIVPDVYDVEIVRNNNAIKTVTVTVYPGANTGHEIETGKDVAVTVTGPYGEAPGADLALRVESLAPEGFDETITIAAADGGKGEITVPELRSSGAGEQEFTYRVSVATAGYCGQAEFSSTSGSVTVKYYPATEIDADPDAANVLYEGYAGKPVEPVGGKIKVPDSAFGLGSFTLYGVKGGEVSISLNGAPQAFAAAHKVSGKLKHTDANDVVTDVKGTVGFIRADGAAVYVPATEDGYGVLLPAGDYDVYAFSTDKKKVHFGKITVADADLEKDLDTEPAREVTGYVRAMHEYLRHVAVTVTSAETTGFPAKLVIMTDNSGKYSVILPEGKGAVVGVTATGFVGTASQEAGGEASAFPYISLNKKIDVTNNTGYKITMYGSTILDGATETVEFTGTSLSDSYITDPADAKVQWSDAASVDPGMTAVTFDTNSVLTLHEYAVDGVTDPEFSVKPMDDDGGKFETSGNKAYLEHGKRFVITVTDGDGKMEIVEKTLLAAQAETLAAKEPLTVKTFVGALPEDALGTLDDSRVYATYSGIEIEFKKKDGAYEGAVPNTGSVKVTAEYTYEFADEGITRKYSASETKDGIPADAGEVMVNVSLRNDGSDPIIPDGENVTAAFEDLVGVMDVTNVKETRLAFKMTVDTSAPKLRTLSLSGTNWVSIRFYEDGALKNEIASVSSDTGSATFYAAGVYDGTVHAADDLKVTFKDLAGTEVAKGTLAGADAKPAWKKTVPDADSTKVGKEPGIAGEYEYYHAVKLVNDDNHSKTFKVKTTFDDSDPKWLATFVTEDGRTMRDVAGGEVNDVVVPGNGATVAYVKFTSAFGEKTSTPKVEFEVTCPGFTVSADGDGVTISADGSTATFESVSQEIDLGIAGASASGRGVFNEDGKVPNVVWALLAGIVLLILLTAWMGMRRGVFTRRK
ncbi:MAG: hypothetical protein GX224_01255, partial [Thermoplasmatales archaeon]|nr:hypothetical protein [Thermoplasmatales archaeon]